MLTSNAEKDNSRFRNIFSDPMQHMSIVFRKSRKLLGENKDQINAKKCQIVPNTFETLAVMLRGY